MKAEPTVAGRSRCKQHGLVLKGDGACLLCGAPSRRGPARVVAALVALVAIPGVLSWRTIRQQSRATSGDDASSAGEADDPVMQEPQRAERRSRMIATSAGPPKVPASEIQPRAEDLHLGEAMVHSPPLTAQPPPPAPRASVDPEPAPADDPRDFEVPGRQ